MENKDLKLTLLLPETSFPIRNKRETHRQIATLWEEKQVYNESLSLNAKKGRRFVIHDGPPYANGPIHIGHLVNRILKDIIVRFHNLTGDQTFFKLGWDTHGLPIEFKVVSSKNEAHKGRIREACREYANEQIEVQRNQLRQLGLLTDYGSNYSTSNNSYEATQLKILAKVVEKKLIYRGLRPVYWSWSHQTALAENEVEYREREDFSLFFKLQLSKPFLTRKHVKLLIWTTQPWTIPGNMFVGVKPSDNYLLFTNGKEFFICSEEYIKKANGRKIVLLKTFKGSTLLGLEYFAPYPGRGHFIIVNAEEMVKTEEGTGILHLAPACGLEDFLLAQKKGIEVSALIDEKGNFSRENPVSELVGVFYQKANQWILDDLAKRGLVDKCERITHSYPHDWRDQSPLVYLLTNQWFVDLRRVQQNLFASIEKVEWVPAYSREKMISFIRNRNDWCISRQRRWGVPIPVIYNNDEAILSVDVINYVAGIVEKEGTDFWFQEGGLEVIKRKFSSKFGKNLTLATDTLDVWFDSGVSSFCVLDKEGSWPADIYLEGNDQFRGWFNSSLILSTIIRELPPYKKVISHGFTVDENGRKMSKSLGNTVDPLALIEKFGIDTLRLWVASVDFTKEIKISDKILPGIQDSYQKLRNCLRFIVASLHTKEGSARKVNQQLFSFHSSISHLNDYLRAYLVTLAVESRSSYQRYNFVNLYNLTNNFCINKLSTFYFEIIKDILYCDPQYSERRQAVLQTLNEILKKILIIIIPIVPFLAEEIYQTVLRNKETFMFKNDEFYSYDSINFIREEEEHPESFQFVEKVENFENSVLLVRKNIFKELERARQGGVIETNQQAVVTLFIPENGKYPPYFRLLTGGSGDDLSLLFIVSEVNIKNANEFSIKIEKTSSLKCERCWRFTVKPNGKLLLCLRCLETLG